MIDVTSEYCANKQCDCIVCFESDDGEVRWRLGLGCASVG